MAATQDHRNIAIETPLGKDVLLLQRLRLTERLNQPFLLDVELLSEDHQIPFQTLPNKSVTVRIDRPAGGKRFVSGIVRNITKIASDSKHVSFRAEVVPWFSLLKLTSDSRIFKSLTVVEILKQVFAEARLSDFQFDLQQKYPVRGICTQYNETNFSFASRLMEQEGIAYRFEHEPKKHTMVLSDSSSAFHMVPGYERIPLLRKTEKVLSEERFETWEERAAVESASITLSEYDYIVPKTNLTAEAMCRFGEPDTVGSLFEAEGRYTADTGGDFYAEVRSQEIECRRIQYRGEAVCAGLGAGNRFTMVGVPGWADDVNCSVTGIQLEIKAADFRVHDRSGLLDQTRCTIDAIPADVTFRPARITPWPRIDGVQTAIVTGPSGNDPKIPFVSSMGSIKVQFRWDRYGNSNEKSSGWIRTSQILAGDGYGAMFIPRVGNEVLVAFENGDPDRPVIVGSLYNAGAMPSLPLPEFAQRLYIHDDGNNAICFTPETGSQSIVFYSPYMDTIRVVGASDEPGYTNVPGPPGFP